MPRPATRHVVGASALRCRALVRGEPCRAFSLRDAEYCQGHRHVEHVDVLIPLVDLWRLAEEFDSRSREAGELYSAAEFLSWLKPELADGG